MRSWGCRPDGCEDGRRGTEREFVGGEVTGFGLCLPSRYVLEDGGQPAAWLPFARHRAVVEETVAGDWLCFTGTRTPPAR